MLVKLISPNSLCRSIFAFRLWVGEIEPCSLQVRQSHEMSVSILEVKARHRIKVVFPTSLLLLLLMYQQEINKEIESAIDIKAMSVVFVKTLPPSSGFTSIYFDSYTHSSLSNFIVSLTMHKIIRAKVCSELLPRVRHKVKMNIKYIIDQ